MYKKPNSEDHVSLTPIILHSKISKYLCCGGGAVSISCYQNNHRIIPDPMTSQIINMK
jgi:hypothetical protein